MKGRLIGVAGRVLVGRKCDGLDQSRVVERNDEIHDRSSSVTEQWSLWRSGDAAPYRYRECVDTAKQQRDAIVHYVCNIFTIKHMKHIDNLSLLKYSRISSCMIRNMTNAGIHFVSDM